MLYVHNNPSPWPELFRECKTEAFHLEVRDAYVVSHESERFRRFLNGDPSAPSKEKNQWVDLIQETTERGVSVGRVRVVTVPHTDYHQWLLSVTGGNVAAGEDIRYLPRHLAGQVPPDDWWLLDNEKVVYNMVDENGKPASFAVTTDPGIAAYCVSVKQRLWELATPYGEYLDSVHVSR